MTDYFGPRFRLLHWCHDQILNDALAKMDLTAAQGHIMGYLARREEAPCSRDIEEKYLPVGEDLYIFFAIAYLIELITTLSTCAMNQAVIHTKIIRIFIIAV